MFQIPFSSLKWGRRESAQGLLISHFPEEKSEAQREGVAHTGSGKSPVPLQWPGVLRSWGKEDRGHAGRVGHQEAMEMGPLQSARRAAQKS